MLNATSPGGEVGFTAEQLMGMTRRVIGCHVSRNAVLPSAYAVSSFYNAILIDRKVPDRKLAETLLAAMDHFIAGPRDVHGMDTQPFALPTLSERPKKGGSRFIRRFKPA